MKKVIDEWIGIRHVFIAGRFDQIVTPKARSHPNLLLTSYSRL